MRRLSKHLDSHRKGEANRALASVLNKGLSKVRTRITRTASNSMQVPQKAIRKRIRIIKARPQNLGGVVWVGTNPMSASSAGAKPDVEGFKLGPYSWPDAFTNSKLKGIYQRKGKSRKPLVVSGFGPQFTESELRQATNKEVKKNINGDLQVDLHREMTYRLDRLFRNL